MKTTVAALRLAQVAMMVMLIVVAPHLVLLARGKDDSREDDGAVNPGSNLFVTGIHPKLSETEISQMFEKYGEVEKCQIMRDPHTKESRGFGFVKMVTSEGADAAKEALQGEQIDGRTLSIEKARRARPRTPTPGKYFASWALTLNQSPVAVSMTVAMTVAAAVAVVVDMAATAMIRTVTEEALMVAATTVATVKNAATIVDTVMIVVVMTVATVTIVPAMIAVVVVVTEMMATEVAVLIDTVAMTVPDTALVAEMTAAAMTVVVGVDMIATAMTARRIERLLVGTHRLLATMMVRDLSKW
ncbi:putative RNA-binding protein C25G10.01 [Ceratocystis platani]|uniref:Putative RNA-binding protein C25G10.01 n=1 Tax=Ceratocystis fimbriata f. sp. platani TaxID=88771 RepID=A0A0F8BU87_CERFI|nr:putative RNA-binding protein C25G10.01 [Ceratocystis platani]